MFYLVSNLVLSKAIKYAASKDFPIDCIVNIVSQENDIKPYFNCLAMKFGLLM